MNITRRSRLKNQKTSYSTLEPRNLLAAFVVNSVADDASGISDGQLTLREAIIAAETNAAFGDAVAGDVDGDTIRFDASLMGQTITLTEGELTITDDLSIFGGNREITVDAGASSRIFNISDVEDLVVLRDFTASGGSAAVGGAALVRDSNVFLNSMTFSDNVATAAGGGAIAFSVSSDTVMTDGARMLTVSNTVFDQNIANGESGSGGAILLNSGVAYVADSTFTANIANRAGGAIEIDNGNFTIVRTALGGESPEDGNVAGPVGTASPGNGGALHVSGRARVSVFDSSVLNNVAASEGGGLWNQANSTMLVNNSEVTGNIARGDGADNGGGGIFNNGGTTRVTNSTIDSNLATGDSGSGGGLFSTDGLLSIIGTTVSSNTANRAGGGVEVVDGRLFILDSDLTNNVAGPEGTASPGNGGALHISGTDGTNTSIVDARVNNNFAASEGGGLWNQVGSGMFVRDSHISGNEAAGDAADEGGGGVFNNGGVTRINRSVIRENVATGTAGSGGGIFSTSGVVSANDSVIAANVANRAGGGVEIVDGRFSLIGSTLGGAFSEEANIAGPEGAASPGNGGGLHITGTNGTATNIIDSTVSFNVAASEGGGLWNQSGSTMVLSNGVVVSNNSALGDGADNGGGGIFNNGGRLAIAEAEIDSNNASGASGSGGGIFSTDGLVTIHDSTISSNVANRAGGGIELIDGTLLMFDSVLGGVGRGNVAGPTGTASPGNGGGLHVTGTDGTTVEVSRSIVSFNVAANEGGGLWNQVGSSLLVRNGSVVNSNSAGTGGGGGLFNNGGVMGVTASTIERNQSTGDGGGVGSIDGSETSIRRSAINFNSAVNGGGVYNDGQLLVRDSVFSLNEASGSGGGLFNDDGGMTDIIGLGMFGNSPNNQS